MAIGTTSCLKLPLPPPTTTSVLPTQNPLISWMRNEKWRKQCVVGMACMVVGLEMVNLGSNEEIAMAMDMQMVAESNEKGHRWSDKRRCPPWHLNSLETIVPENLPRPSARRRWESIGYSNIARQVTVKTTISNSCFST